MKHEKKPFTKSWLKAKKLTEEKDIEKAVPLLEIMIIRLAQMSTEGIKNIEGVNIDLWKERAWLSLENLGVLPEYNEEK